MAICFNSLGKPRSISIARFDPALNEPDWTSLTIFKIKDADLAMSELTMAFDKFHAEMLRGIKLQIALRQTRKLRKKLDALIGQSGRRFTYKTLRHDCAKRNGRR